MAKANTSILVVDDSSDTLEVLERNLTAEGYHVLAASGVEQAIELLEQRPVDLVITDLKMPRVSGLDLVRYVRENLKDAEVMMITGYATVESAVEAVKTGAEEYLPKPFTNDELLSAVGRALDKLRQRRLLQPRTRPPTPSAFGIVGGSSAMGGVLDAASRAARSSATILLSGESGVGKELVARAIHEQSPRADAPFIPINSGAIPGELFESELFGHEKGAFTGATESRGGLFQAASGGTVFLDEISEMPAALQVKLLRVLQDGEVWMVGAAKARKVDVRIVAATNQDLLALVKEGRFREDLYYRVSVITIEVPPLRDRGEDVLELAQHFATRFACDVGRTAPDFTDAAARALRAYRWPGNVRELENLVQNLVIMTDSAAIDVSDLPSLMRFNVARADAPTRSLAQMELEYIQRVLASVGGNKTRAAKILGIDRKTLREKLKGSG
jgi:DNA-binding NtrC family response regulator